MRADQFVLDHDHLGVGGLVYDHVAAVVEADRERRPARLGVFEDRVRILDAAEAVFAEFGTRASTEEVARRAGVAIGTVFRHFPTKDDLLAAIMKRLLAQLVEEE